MYKVKLDGEDGSTFCLIGLENQSLLRAGIASLLIYDWKLSLREEKKTVTLIPISLNTNIDIYIREILRPILIGIPTSLIVWSIKPSIRLNSLLIKYEQ